MPNFGLIKINDLRFELTDMDFYPKPKYNKYVLSVISTAATVFLLCNHLLTSRARDKILKGSVLQGLSPDLLICEVFY